VGVVAGLGGLRRRIGEIAEAVDRGARIVAESQKGSAVGDVDGARVGVGAEGVLLSDLVEGASSGFYVADFGAAGAEEVHHLLAALVTVDPTARAQVRWITRYPHLDGGPGVGERVGVLHTGILVVRFPDELAHGGVEVRNIVVHGKFGVRAGMGEFARLDVDIHGGGSAVIESRIPVVAAEEGRLQGEGPERRFEVEQVEADNRAGLERVVGLHEGAVVFDVGTGVARPQVGGEEPVFHDDRRLLDRFGP